MPGVTQLFKVALQRAERDQTRANRGGALQEPRRRFFEVELHGQRVDHFAAIVVIDHF